MQNITRTKTNQGKNRQTNRPTGRRHEQAFHKTGYTDAQRKNG